MTKDEFLALPAKARKSLAAIRSRAIAVARRTGQPIPPTYGEEFGLRTRKHLPMVKTVDHKTKASVASLVPETLVHHGEVPSTFREILGCLHWVRGYDMAQYEAEARLRGLIYKVPYFLREELVGMIFTTEEVESLKEKVLTVLTGSQPGKVFYFAENIPLLEASRAE